MAKNVESALSGNAATMTGILKSYVDTVVISLDSSHNSSEMQVIYFCNIKKISSYRLKLYWWSLDLTFQLSLPLDYQTKSIDDSIYGIHDTGT